VALADAKANSVAVRKPMTAILAIEADEDPEWPRPATGQKSQAFDS
jgi:hypothetical protein